MDAEEYVIIMHYYVLLDNYIKPCDRWWQSVKSFFSPAHADKKPKIVSQHILSMNLPPWYVYCTQYKKKLALSMQ